MPYEGNAAVQGEANASITVCVPVYNVERYVRECLDSIFSQDYENFDVVMVDDGSTDSSGAICDEYAERFPQRAFVVHKDNEGLLLARRDGFERAAGQYVMCVDSDDVLVPGAIAAIGSLISKTDADVVRYGFTRNIDEAVPVASDVAYELYPNAEKSKMLRALCCSTSGSENPMWFKAVRHECVGVDVDFSAFKGLSYAEDFLQTLTVYDRAQTFCFTDARLYYYRPGSGITRAYNPHFYRDVHHCLNAAEDFARRWEKEYACEGLLVGLAACRLDSAAQYTEWMASQGDKSGLNALRQSKDFVRYMEMTRTQRLLRADRRIALSLLQGGHYNMLQMLAKARDLARKLK